MKDAMLLALRVAGPTEWVGRPLRDAHVHASDGGARHAAVRRPTSLWGGGLRSPGTRRGDDEYKERCDTEDTLGAVGRGCGARVAA